MGAFTQADGRKVIQGTFEYYGVGDFMRACCIERTGERGKFRGGTFRKFQELRKSQIKARYPDLFISAFQDMMNGLRQDGIETSFIYSPEYRYNKPPQKSRLYQFPLEQLSTECRIEDWFDKESGFFWVDYVMFKCAYRFQF